MYRGHDYLNEEEIVGIAFLTKLQKQITKNLELKN